MLEDKLTRDERIRLEALAQAVAMNMQRNLQSNLIIQDAKKLEDYIRGDMDGFER